ncbi:hypothetical protein HW35_02410 [Bacillus sp. X1(2014)]|nr:hypothetical protein HW35_02410 [Bacillus sp. X1(2014)]
MVVSLLDLIFIVQLSVADSLSHQKSAEVIVRIGLEQFGRTEQLRENSPLHSVCHVEHRKCSTSLEEGNGEFRGGPLGGWSDHWHKKISYSRKEE